MPILSICIPTFNRADLLKLALQSLLPQVAELKGKVEVIVSDNCSTDHTQQVVEIMQRNGPIRYYRNSTNIGAARNINCVASELAAGEFCWILGDDDMIIQGKLSKLVGIIEAHSHIDYFFVNYCQQWVEVRNRLIVEKNSSYSPTPQESMCQDFSERLMPNWLQILSIDAQKPAELHTAIVCHVFRRSIWRAEIDPIKLNAINPDKLISSFDTDFLHINVLARATLGKPVYYIGDPCVLLGIGHQEWWKYLSTVMLGHLHEAMDLYRSLGADERIIEHHHRHLLSYSGPYIWRTLFKPNSKQDYLLLLKLFRRFWMYKDLWMSLVDAVVNAVRPWFTQWLRMRARRFLPGPLYVLLRAAWRLPRALSRFKARAGSRP